MELQEMQQVWQEMSLELNKQKKLTNDIIMKMTQEKYSNKFTAISRYEMVGAVLCYSIAMYILSNFSKLDTWYLQSCGILTLLYLTTLPILVLRSLKKIKNLNIINKNYKEAIYSYTKEKKYLLLLQKFAVLGSFLVMFFSLPVFSMIFGKKDFFKIDLGLSFYITSIIVLVFLFFFARWGFKSYLKITNSAEHILKELEQND
tara:strand:- start:69465 stop:70073 length:609 start_codon:yes stop_codon:yes gene_type:complete